MSHLVNGKKLASEIQHQLLKYTTSLDSLDSISFHIVYAGSDPVIDNFIKYKKRFGEFLGVEVCIHHFPETISQRDLAAAISRLAIDERVDAMIVQLPLPGHLDTQALLDLVPVNKDVDVLGNEALHHFQTSIKSYLPPVTGSIVHILQQHNIVLEDKKILVIGNGALVGYPMSLWLDKEHYSYDLVTKETSEEVKKNLMKQADIIIAGAGVPGLVQVDMISRGVVLIDAGTSESGKKVVGDIHPGCIEKASLMTPVPGGIGPLTIAVLYQNIIAAHMKKYDQSINTIT